MPQKYVCVCVHVHKTLARAKIKVNKVAPGRRESNPRRANREVQKLLQRYVVRAVIKTERIREGICFGKQERFHGRGSGIQTGSQRTICILLAGRERLQQVQNQRNLTADSGVLGGGCSS